MNVANKLTISRIVIAILILFLLLFPWQDINFAFPTILISGKIIVDSKYIIAGILFLIAILTDFLDGYFARMEKKVTDFGSILDNTADKILINGVLISLSYNGFILLFVPIIVIISDLIVDGLKILVAKNGTIIKQNKYQKITSICMYLGILLSLFYNLPFEIWGIFISEILIDVAAILSVVTGYFYFLEWKEKYKKLDEMI